MTASLSNIPASREREVFLAALERCDGIVREDFLSAACGDDSALLKNVKELLREHYVEDDFLEQPAIDPVSRSAEVDRLAAQLKPEEGGDRIGSYKLLEQIGEGGYGVVWMAEQEQPVRRRVALKIIKVGMDTKEVIARFEQERQALAMMEHPNIAKVFDAGATPFGRPYFVMELVRGVPITGYCDDARLTMRQRLELFVRVCQAVQHAHQKGIIHRDIKPTNILVTLHDGVPVPKVIDFGVAKATQHRLTELTLFTRFEQMIGTPLYMSPEQAEMSGLDIDTRSDIYALGVLLYEMLAGRTPLDAVEFKKHGYDEMRRAIREEEPARPSLALQTMPEATRTKVARLRESDSPDLVHALEGDLDWIVMKALEKDRTRRYESASGLGADIQRHLDNEPVLARPPTLGYRLQKLCKRHRGAFAAGGVAVSALVLGLGISVWQAVRATQAEKIAYGLRHQEAQLRHEEARMRQRAEREGAAAKLNEYVADIGLAAQSLRDGNYRRGIALLTKHQPKPGEPDLRGFEWRYLWQLANSSEHFSLPQQEGPVQSLVFAPNGDTLVIGLQEKLNAWDVGTRLMRTISPRSSRQGPQSGSAPFDSRSSVFWPRGFMSLAFLPDERTLVTGGPAGVRVWNADTWEEQRSFAESAGPAVLSTDGSLLSMIQRGRGRSSDIAIWATKGWTQTRVVPGAMSPVAFSPDGSTFASSTESGIVLRAVNGPSSEVLLKGSAPHELRGGPVFLTAHTLTFSRDGKVVVAARNVPTERGVFVLSIWDSKSGSEIGTMPVHAQQIEYTGIISAVAFSPDGRILATASLDHSVRLWDFEKRERIGTLNHLAEVWTLAFSHDGQTLATGTKDGNVKLWPLENLEDDSLYRGASTPLAFSSDGGTLVATSSDGAVSFLNSRTGEIEQRFPLEGSHKRLSAFAISSDLRTLVQAVGDGTLKVSDLAGGKTNSLKASSRPVEWLALSPNGLILITGRADEQPRWWDLREGTSDAWPVAATRVQFSPDGRSMAVFLPNDIVQLWDVATRTLRTTVGVESALSGSTAFSADGRYFASAWQNDTIRLWDVFTGQLLGTFVGHKQPVFSVAFSPDGRTLASSSDDSTVRLWNVATQQELLVVLRLGETLTSTLFSPDGRLLVGGARTPSRSEALRLFRAPLLGETHTTTAP